MPYTDYPIVELGDDAGELAPVRECRPIRYDGNKYTMIEVGGKEVEIKAGYIYATACRSGDEKPLDPKTY